MMEDVQQPTEGRDPEQGDVYSCETGEHLGYIHEEELQRLRDIHTAMNIQILVGDRWHVYKLHEIIKAEATDAAQG